MIDRSQGLGGTDIAAVVGVHPYKTALDVYLEKIGERPPVEENQAMRWGLILEEPIARWYSEVTGMALKRCPTQFHKEHPFLFVSPDRITIEDKPRLVEIKTASVYQARHWGDPEAEEIPEQYLCQVQWGMELMNFPQVDVTVLLGGQDARIYPIERNRELGKKLVDVGIEFWQDFVCKRRSPPIDGSRACSDYLNQRWATSRGEMLKVDENYKPAWEYFMLKAKIEQETEELERQKNVMKDLIREAIGIQGKTWRITWKKNKDSQKTDYKALWLEFMHWLPGFLYSNVEVIGETEWAAIEAQAQALEKQHTISVPGVRRFIAKLLEEDAHGTNINGAA